jgi:hypothetical protein
MHKLGDDLQHNQMTDSLSSMRNCFVPKPLFMRHCLFSKKAQALITCVVALDQFLRHAGRLSSQLFQHEDSK